MRRPRDIPPPVVGTQPQAERWGVEKRIRVEFVVGLMLTIAGFVWYASQQDQILKSMDGRLLKVEMSNVAEAQQRGEVRDRITRIEGKQELTVEILNRVEAQLNRRPPPPRRSE